MLLPGRADVGYIRFVAYFDTPCSGCRDIQSAERNGGYIRWQVPSGRSLTDAHLALASAMTNFLVDVMHYLCRPLCDETNYPIVVHCIQTSILGLRNSVIIQYREGLDAGIRGDDVEQAADFTLVETQYFTRSRHLRQGDAMQVSLVAAAVVQSRDDFLARVTALVDGDGAQAMQRQRRRQQFVQYLRGQPGPARAQLRQAPCVVAGIFEGDPHAVRAAAERKCFRFAMDFMNRLGRAGGQPA